MTAIEARQVKPNTSGTLFLLQVGEGVYRAMFVRVRVVMGQINMQDVQNVAAYAGELEKDKIPFISFAAGRNTPYPEYAGDLDELRQGTGAVILPGLGKKLDS